MTIYSKGRETRKKFIRLTYQMLQEQDASALKVRDIAGQLGCSAAALYRHFDSLEYLIVLASIGFLDGYMKDYARLLDSDQNSLEIYLNGWKMFLKYAFERPDVYYRLFWGQYNSVFENAVHEYFDLFPMSVSEKYPAYYHALFFNRNMRERDWMMLQRAADEKLLTIEEAEYFSKTNPLIAMGMLLEYMNEPLEKRRQAGEECGYLLEKNLERVKVL